MLIKIRRLIKRIIRGEWVFKPEIKRAKIWLGNNYGGFYLCPDGIDSNSIVFSVGIGEDISFDSAIINQFDCKVYGFDPTPKSINWIKSNQKLPKNFEFHPFGIGDFDGEATFYLPKISEHVSGSILQNNIVGENTVNVPIKKLATAMKLLSINKVNVLKMDIEGAEYSVIDDIVNSGIEFDQILVEFHHRMLQNGLSKTKNAVNQLNKAGYQLFAISENGEEFSFIKTT